MKDYLFIAIELIFGFIALFIVMKWLGKSHLSQLTPFDFISALIMGELLGNAVYDHEVHIWEVLFASMVWGGLIYTNAWVTQKWRRLRKTLEGEPSIMISGGVIQYKQMKKNRLDLNELQSLVRQQGYFSLQEVEFAILETNGKLSVMPRPSKDIPRRSEWNLPEPAVHLPVSLIMDGELLYDNLFNAGLDERWLLEKLGAQQIKRLEDVFYAEWLEGGKLYVCTYN